MELEDGFDELLAEISEPTSPKKPKVEDESAQPGTSKETASKPTSSKTHCVLVNQKQRGNPVLKFITSVPWEYDDVIPDYEIGKTIGILFISVRYHNMNPDYINNRLKELGKKYELRVLLVQHCYKCYDHSMTDEIMDLPTPLNFISHPVIMALTTVLKYRESHIPDFNAIDLKDPHIPLKSLTRICLLTDMTLMLAWSPEEAAKVIENYKIYENKPPDRIMERIENDPHQKIINALTSVRSVNKTDAMTLVTTFGTLENIIRASESRLAECPGFGLTKAKKLYTALHQPFLKRGHIEKSKFEGDLSIEDVEKIETEMLKEDSTPEIVEKIET